MFIGDLLTRECDTSLEEASFVTEFSEKEVKRAAWRMEIKNRF